MNDFVLMLKKQLLRKKLRMIRDNPRVFSTTFFYVENTLITIRNY